MGGLVVRFADVVQAYPVHRSVELYLSQQTVLVQQEIAVPVIDEQHDCLVRDQRVGRVIGGPQMRRHLDRRSEQLSKRRHEIYADADEDRFCRKDSPAGLADTVQDGMARFVRVEHFPRFVDEVEQQFARSRFVPPVDGKNRMRPNFKTRQPGLGLLRQRASGNDMAIDGCAVESVRYQLFAFGSFQHAADKVETVSLVHFSPLSIDGQVLKKRRDARPFRHYRIMKESQAEYLRPGWCLKNTPVSSRIV